MSRTIDLYAGPRGAAAAPDLGSSASTEHVTWNGKVHAWSDLPASVRDANEGGHVEVEGVHLAPGARLIKGVPHQVMYGWRVWSDLVVVVSIVRPLAARPDGRLAPAGPWVELVTDEYRASAPSIHTRSAIATGRPDDAGGLASTGGAGALPRRQARAAEVFAFLPSPVRGRLVKAVPSPDVWLGELSRWDVTGSRDVEEELVMLRLGATSAVALRAARQGRLDRLASQDWTIDRFTFDLGPARPALEAPGPRRVRR